MTTRRELLTAIPGLFLPDNATTNTPQSRIGDNGIQCALEQIKQLISAELSGISKIEIRFDPSDERVPLMVIAMRD